MSSAATRGTSNAKDNPPAAEKIKEPKNPRTEKRMFGL
jgi:hypothetical protein